MLDGLVLSFDFNNAVSLHFDFDVNPTTPIMFDWQNISTNQTKNENTMTFNNSNNNMTFNNSTLNMEYN